MAITAPSSLTTPFQTYGQNGKKLSFANWISNISPEDTPFVSMTGKESIDQTLFSWQVDSLAPASADNAQPEGFTAGYDKLNPTTTIQNVTQLLAKTVSVSDTANATANYGRGRELMYQLEKAGAEIKRDLEAVFLNNGNAQAGNSTADSDKAGVRKTGGVKALIGRDSTSGLTNEFGKGKTNDGQKPSDDFEVITRKTHISTTNAAGAAFESEVDVAFEADLFSLTEALYTVGAKANVIMVHPSMAKRFTYMQGKVENGGSAAPSIGGATRVRMFDNRKDIVLQVSTLTDPLGQTFKVVYNRYMPKHTAFIFNPSDWTQMVLRAPQRTELAKNGDATQWMITMETGLRHRNPYASAWLEYLPKP